MNSYFAAHLDAIFSTKAPQWKGKLLDDVAVGHILMSDDEGDTWRLVQAGCQNMTCAGIAMEIGRKGQIITMTSRMDVVIPAQTTRLREEVSWPMID